MVAGVDYFLQQMLLSPNWSTLKPSVHLLDPSVVLKVETLWEIDPVVSGCKIYMLEADESETASQCKLFWIKSCRK